MLYQKNIATFILKIMYFKLMYSLFFYLCNYFKGVNNLKKNNYHHNGSYFFVWII